MSPDTWKPRELVWWCCEEINVAPDKRKIENDSSSDASALKILDWIAKPDKLITDSYTFMLAPVSLQSLKKGRFPDFNMKKDFKAAHGTSSSYPFRNSIFYAG